MVGKGLRNRVCERNRQRGKQVRRKSGKHRRQCQTQEAAGVMRSCAFTVPPVPTEALQFAVQTQTSHLSNRQCQADLSRLRVPALEAWGMFVLVIARAHRKAAEMALGSVDSETDTESQLRGGGWGFGVVKE